jgi:copper oxidase (laccase) domain-containing protein
MEALGAERGRITAVVGPCIAQASYEVRADLRDAVGDARFFAPGRDAEHFQFDLAGYCVARLRAAGVAGEAMGLDTLADAARFFSHRRRTLAGGGPLGHQLSAIML